MEQPLPPDTEPPTTRVSSILHDLSVLVHIYVHSNHLIPTHTHGNMVR